MIANCRVPIGLSWLTSITHLLRHYWLLVSVRGTIPCTASVEEVRPLLSAVKHLKHFIKAHGHWMSDAYLVYLTLCTTNKFNIHNSITSRLSSTLKLWFGVVCLFVIVMECFIFGISVTDSLYQISCFN